MDRADFRHIGGAVIADHGPIPLTRARAMMRAYRQEAERSSETMAGECRRRADLLDEAIRSATLWRLAAGWTHPERADSARPLRGW